MSDNITREPYRNAWYKQLSDAVKKHDEEIAEMTPHLVPDVEEGDNGKILIAGEDGAFDWGQPPEELPVITEGDEGKVLKVDEGVPKWLEDQDAEIPSHTASDEGKLLSVNAQNNLEWKDVPKELPIIESTDEGKILSVEDGEPKWTDADVAIAEALTRFSEVNRNNIYRGANLLSKYTIEQLHEKVNSGDFSDMYIGDYIPITADYSIKEQFTGTTFESGVAYYEKSGSYPNWVFTETTDVTPQEGKIYYYTREFTATNKFAVAHFNYLVGIDEVLDTPNHIILVPKGRINKLMSNNVTADGRWNVERTVAGGYFASYVHQILLPQYFNIFNTFFNNHLMSWNEELTTDVDLTVPSTALYTLTGTSKSVTKKTMSIRLMNECMIYGCPIASSSMRDNTMYEQLALFKLKKLENYYRDGIDTGRGAIWTSSVGMQYGAGYISGIGSAGIGVVTSHAGLMPFIAFG